MSRPSATQWFNQWHVYRSIVDANWMAHRDIFNAVRTWVLLRHPGPFTLNIHVRRGGGEAVFAVEPEVELRESVGFNVRELSRAEDLIHDHLELIKRKWAERLG
jgi:hypothetical protein